MKIYFTAAVSLLFLLFSASGLFAQPENIPDDFAEVGTPPVTGSIGVGVGYAPEFIGSDSYKAGFMPVIFLNYGPVFLSSDKGLGVRFDLFNGSLEISPAVNYRFGRKESDSLLLAGMGDLDGVVTLGGTIAYKFEDFVLSVKTFQGVNEYKGLTMDLKAAYLNRSHESFNYGFSAYTTLADKAYNQANFGVSEEQASRSAYPVYNADSGFMDVGFKGSFDYYLTPQFSIDVFAGYNHLLGEAAASPLVERGSEDQFSTGVAFFYHFGR